MHFSFFGSLKKYIFFECLVYVQPVLGAGDKTTSKTKMVLHLGMLPCHGDKERRMNRQLQGNIFRAMAGVRCYWALCAEPRFGGVVSGSGITSSHLRDGGPLCLAGNARVIHLHLYSFIRSFAPSFRLLSAYWFPIPWQALGRQVSGKRVYRNEEKNYPAGRSKGS